ncbi:MAG: Ig-like domain-containing protein [Caldilineaceae bacterium]
MPKASSGVRHLLVLLVCVNLLNLGVPSLAPAAVAASARADFSTAHTDAVAPAHRVTPPTTATEKPAPPALAGFAPFPGPAPDALTLFAPATQLHSSVIHITAAGFDPPTLSLFGPTDVTWINDTATTHTLRSGEPGDTPSGSPKIYLPLVAKGSSSAVAAAMNYLQEARQHQSTQADFDATLAPGATFTYRFTAVGDHSFYLVTATQYTGKVTLGGTAILRTSPANGEDGVSSTRETIITFSNALDPATVTAAAFTATFGGQNLAYRLNLSPDKTRVTLFYNNPLPGSARIRLTIDGSKLKDAQGLNVDVDGDGAAGGAQLIEFDTLSLTVIPGTAVCGRVFASQLAVTASGVAVNTPLEGATITVDGMADTLRAVTDANGNFCLDPAPAGRFFVHIDGRTATKGVPTGAYYPYVGKAWVSTPGQQTNIGDAFLPLVGAGTLQTVSQSQDTLITFPDAVLNEHSDFAGVSILVPADALYKDDGNRGGKVGIAPVPPDRLPGQLPEGLNFPVVITVQTDGATNFDIPAPVCFPNLPDPTTGQTLAAGAKSALWSFDHDAGRWDVVGPMTVSSDGKLVCTDDGVGIRAPGWHGANPFSWLPPLDRFKPRCNQPFDQISCATSIMAGFIDCALSFTPAGVVGCEFAAAIGGLAVARDCALAGSPDSFGCHVSVGVSGAGLGLACLTRLSPVVGQVVACGGAIVSAGAACGCTIGLQAAGLQSAATTNLEKHLQLLESYENFYTIIYGADVWLQAVEATGNPIAVADQVQALLDQAIGKTAKSSDGGEKVTNAEAAQLKSLPRPNTISEADINQLVSYWNNTYDLWQQGLTTHAQAGRTDFMDATQYDQALNQVEAAINAVEASGADEINMRTAMFGVIDDLATADPAPGSAIYYALVDEDNGQTYRGKLSNDGRINVAGIRPETFHRLKLYEPNTNGYTSLAFVSARAGVETALPEFHLLSTSGEVDTDQDGIADVAEAVVGTKTDNPDSDGDGISDGAEVTRGTDPLSNVTTQTGIIGSADTPGTAVDLCVENNLAAVADSAAGVALLNVFDSMNPILVAQVDTPGNAQRVACSAANVAVADGAGGLALLDTSDAANARVTHQLDLNGEVTAVAMAGNTVYAATAAGRIVAVDPNSGQVTAETSVADAVQDLALQAETLYALTTQKLYAIDLHGAGLTVSGAVDAPGTVGAGGRRWRLFVGGDLGYATHSRGYDTFDLTFPTQPTLIAAGQTQQVGWKQIVVNGAGVGVAAVGVNSTNDGAHNISLYDVSDPQQTDQPLVQFETPGLAAAVRIDHGLAYVADSASGLEVVNYLANDNQKTAPTLALSTNYAPGKAEEGALMRITATTTDDVQVSNVEFYADGALIAVDGSFPFEQYWLTPRLAQQASFKLRARAIDTGGNETWTDEQTIVLTQDATPPRVISVTPANGAIGDAGAVKTVTISFNEAVAQNTVTTASFKLFKAGADEVPGTADDVEVTGGAVAMPNPTTATLTFGAGLSADRYRVVLSTAVTDAAGNPLSKAFTPTFRLVPFIAVGAVVTAALTTPGEEDLYHFTATPGQQIYFDVQQSMNAGWQATDATGAVIFNTCLGCGDPGVKTLSVGGTYTITVGSTGNQNTGTYQFQIWNVPAPQVFNINVGDVVADGAPGAGAGNIETPGVRDIYHFTATPGQQIYFDVQQAINANWQATDATGAVLFNTCLGCGDPGVQMLTVGGSYTITVGNDRGDGTGAYQFQIWNVPAPQVFNINVGDVVADGAPGAGAGNIETPGVRDIYHFSASAGQQIYFDVQQAINANWQATDATGAVLFNTCLGCGDPGAQTLTVGGTYTITVGNDRGDGTGAYQFQIWNVPAAQVFTIAIGDTVSDGVPSAGAGNIETPGVKDIYHFTATAGQQVNFDVQQAISANWQLTDAGGTVIFNTCLGCGDPGVKTLSAGGTYTITVGNDRGDGTGAYQFQITAQ